MNDLQPYTSLTDKDISEIVALVLKWRTHASVQDQAWEPFAGHPLRVACNKIDALAADRGRLKRIEQAAQALVDLDLLNLTTDYPWSVVAEGIKNLSAALEAPPVDSALGAGGAIAKAAQDAGDPA